MGGSATQSWSARCGTPCPPGSSRGHSFTLPPLTMELKRDSPPWSAHISKGLDFKRYSICFQLDSPIISCNAVNCSNEVQWENGTVALLTHHVHTVFLQTLLKKHGYISTIFFYVLDIIFCNLGGGNRKRMNSDFNLHIPFFIRPLKKNLIFLKMSTATEYFAPFKSFSLNWMPCWLDK